jgi:hypothetical protein
VPVLIIEKHLVASDKRMTYSDTKQKGFALRTTPNGVFTFYYQHLNEKTGKRDWHLIYRCSHSMVMSADQWPDDLRLSDIEPRFVCKACGKRGADVRPDFLTEVPGSRWKGQS